MQTKLIALIVAIVASMSVFVLYNTTSSDERKVLNAFHKAEMPVPDYVTVDVKQGNSYSITYGLGGRTCTSLIKIEDNKVTKVLAKECTF